MPNYLDLNYPEDEYSPDKYPQKLCDYLTKRFFLNKGHSGKVLLDIGSGKGNALVGFSRNGFNVKGIDKRNECVNILPDFDIRECDLEKDNFSFEDNYFDYIYSKSVLEHIYNTEHIIKETYRTLKPGGITVQLTPDWATDYKNFWDDPTHVKPFTRKGLQNAFELGNFVNVKCESFYQLPFLWKYPSLTFVTRIISLVPDSLKWKDKEERIQRVLIRHSKERMLLLSARKPY
ncbi:MAG: class I SAM-dependent methyltransferase [Proteobacteria bacterium]|nr:class I SAM-dependent methyltransferase [Pseudomonadota bacterium]MCG2831220.1 class I SAM-dependent methyltransferase [Desulfobacteraceae bacterium]